MTLELPPTLQARLDELPAGLGAHVGRVRAIARSLGQAHGVDADLAELTYNRRSETAASPRGSAF